MHDRPLKTLIFFVFITYSWENNDVQIRPNYCDIECNGTRHTMCEYPAGGGDNCKNNQKVYLAAAEKKYIEDLLNTARHEVVKGGVKGLPRAANMMKLVWSKELTMIAKRWADQCEQPMHDVCRKTLSGADTGQSVHISTFHKSTFESGPKIRNRLLRALVGVWTAEKQFFKPQWVRSYDRSAETTTGNFSQIIWAETTYVGCGYTEFTYPNHTMARFVCNYERKGNIEGAPVYLEGPPCSKCPQAASCSAMFKGMCWNKDYDDFQEDDAPPSDSRRPQCSMLIFVISFGWCLRVVKTLYNIW